VPPYLPLPVGCRVDVPGPLGLGAAVPVPGRAVPHAPAVLVLGDALGVRGRAGRCRCLGRRRYARNQKGSRRRHCQRSHDPVHHDPHLSIDVCLLITILYMQACLPL
jgi:hypothetical protein